MCFICEICSVKEILVDLGKYVKYGEYLKFVHYQVMLLNHLQEFLDKTQDWMWWRNWVHILTV